VSTFAGIAARLNRIEMEHDNLRAALGWSQSAIDSAELGLRLAGALSDFWYIRGDWNEARAWLDGALGHPEAADYSKAQARACIELALILLAQGDYAAAQAQLAHALILTEGLGDLTMSGWTIFYLGLLAREHGDTTTARLKLEESLTLFHEIGNKVGVAVLLGAAAVWGHPPPSTSSRPAISSDAVSVLTRDNYGHPGESVLRRASVHHGIHLRLSARATTRAPPVA